MHGAVGWLLTLVFAGLVWPCVSRLVRLDYVRLGRGVRNGDLVELLLVVAMVAMLSPVGGPIPAAGWQAILVLTTGWFAVAWWRGRVPPSSLAQSRARPKGSFRRPATASSRPISTPTEISP